METKNKNCKPIERRKQTRWSVYNFLRATATISDCPTGLLADISQDGALVILPRDCEKNLNINQNVSMLIKTSLENCNVSLIAQIKSITVVEDDNNLRVGVLFLGLEKNQRVKEIIKNICEYGQKLQAINTTKV